VIKKDQTGKWCKEFVRWVEGADVVKLQNDVARKDKTDE